MPDGGLKLLPASVALPARIFAMLCAEYLTSGYMYSGCLSPTFITRKLGLDDAEVCGALEELRAAGLARVRGCVNFMYELTPHVRVALIEAHNLSRRWEDEAWFFYPNAPYGEIGNVRREAAGSSLAEAA
jgi:hypothetical protein